MKLNIIPASQIQLRQSPRILDHFAKRIVLSKLNHIKKGFLTIIDDSQIYEYGTMDSHKLNTVITVRSPSFYSAVAFNGSIGAGESYFLGDWDCDNLTNLVRLLLVNRNVIDTMDSGFSRLQTMIHQVFHWFNRNTLKGSRRNIAAHYDIGNDFFDLMLDSRMMYSSAIYRNEHNTLEKAAVYKLDHICQKLQLTKSDHLLEIGTGWGGMAIHAAKYYGCHVTTTTISEEQYKYVQNKIKEENLDDKITLLFLDYRKLTGQYDKLVSIEMIEAVGLNNLALYFKKCSSLLKHQGLMCLQAITIADQRYEQAKKNVDFIQKYIFPGGGLPSISAMSNAISSETDMQIYNLEDIGLHYAQTLRDWRERFFHNETLIKKLGYNDTFIRLWEFYLCYCEAGFMERSISTVQLTLTKPECRNKD